jgi:hypothetical protein
METEGVHIQRFVLAVLAVVKPAFVGKSILELVAIVSVCRGWHNDIHVLHLNFGNAGKGIIYGLLFEFQLCIVGHVLPFTAPTGAKMLAESFDSVFGWLDETSDLTFAKILFAAINLYIGNIAGNGLFYEQNKIVGFANAFAFFGYINYRYVLKNFIYPWFARSAHKDAKVNLFIKTETHDLERGDLTTVGFRGAEICSALRTEKQRDLQMG